MPTITLTGAQALVRLLQAERCPAAYGIVGGKLAPLLHALSQSDIPFISVRHEASAAIMAAAAYASTGRVALAFGEMGPGGLNLAAGAGVAFNNHLAALLVTTNQHLTAAYPRQRPAGGARLPHPICAAPGRAGVRQHEPVWASP